MIRKVLFVSTLVFALPAYSAPPKAKDAPAAKVEETAAPKVGETAPDFTLKGADGKEYKLSTFKGKNVVLEWFNNDCPYVKKYYDAKKMQELQKTTTAKKMSPVIDTVWFVISSNAKGKEGHMTAEDAKKIYTERGMAATAILLDEKGEVGKKYQAKTTPHMFVIDSEGKLAYMGAIDDKPSASAKSLEGATNHVAAAVAAVEKKEKPKLVSTTPYGCSVKYL